MKYAIYFVPHLRGRKKLSKLRSELCKRYKSNKALHYPVHMTLTLGVRINDYLRFEKELKEFCKNNKKKIIKAKKYTDVSPNYNWCGIHLIGEKGLINFQKNLQKIVDKHSVHKGKRNSPLHITLVYETNLTGLNKIRNPVHKFSFDRITIVKKSKNTEKYKIHKHIQLK